MWFRCRQDVDWQWVVFRLGSDTRIQIYGDWLKDRFLGPFHCFLSTALLSQQWGNCFILLFILLLHCGVNQALFFWILLLLINKLIGEL